MEHFSIILALCRAALQNPNAAVENHLRRLVSALEKDGLADKAKSVQKLLTNSASSLSVQPTRVVLSEHVWSGEALTKNTKPPIDKETSSPLAEVCFPEAEHSAVPMYEPVLSAGIKNLVDEWSNVRKLLEAGVDPAFSLMIFGAPGTGKTLLAHHIASVLRIPLVVARLDGLVSSFLGTTARNISNLFQFADRYKCILLLDEFDALAKLRDDPNELGELKRVVNTLLQCLDGRSQRGFTIAITNHHSLLDSAIWRRFDIRIEVPNPNFKVRGQMVKCRLQGVGLSDAEISFLNWVTEGYSGSDIDKLTNFLKRKLALLGEEFKFLESVKEYILLSASQVENRNRKLAVGRTEDLAYALHQDPEAGMHQDFLAEIFGKSQPTISRWLKHDKVAGGPKVV